jgi:hypothetical protein
MRESKNGDGHCQRHTTAQCRAGNERASAQGCASGSGWIIILKAPEKKKCPIPEDQLPTEMNNAAESGVVVRLSGRRNPWVSNRFY